MTYSANIHASLYYLHKKITLVDTRKLIIFIDGYIKITRFTSLSNYHYVFYYWSYNPVSNISHHLW